MVVTPRMRTYESLLNYIVEELETLGFGKPYPIDEYEMFEVIRTLYQQLKAEQADIQKE